MFNLHHPISSVYFSNLNPSLIISRKMSARLETSMTTKNYEATWSTSHEKLLTNERKLKDLLDISSSNDEESILCSFGVSGGATISRLFARKSIVWAKDSLERLPIRLTLENVGVFTLFLVLLMPRAITYWLLYPIFRLVFGTLYPAYASYKAVRTKNVKEYVSFFVLFIILLMDRMYFYVRHRIDLFIF